MDDVKDPTKVIKVGDDLLKVDGRGRVIGKVTASTEVVTKEDLKSFATIEAVACRYASKAELEAVNPDLSNYLTRLEAQRYILKKHLAVYPNREEVVSMIKAQEFIGLVREPALQDLVKRSELVEYVTKDGLANIVSPGLLAKLATKRDLLAYATKESLSQFADKDKVLYSDKNDQVVSGSLEVRDRLTEHGSRVKTADSTRDTVSTRIVESGPAKLTDSDEYVIILNNSGALFGAILPKGKKGLRFAIKDGLGNSESYNIKVVASEGDTIDGRSLFILHEDYGKVVLVHNGKEWNVF